MLSLVLLLFAQFTVPMHTGALAASGGGSVAYTGNHCDNNAASGTTLACTITASTGDTLVGDTQLAFGVSVSAVDSSGDTVIFPSTCNATWASAVLRTVSFYIHSTFTGSHTITITYGAPTTSPDMAVHGYSGANASAPMDGNCVIGTGSLPTALDSGAITVSNPNSMVVAFGEVASGAATLSAGTSFTLVPTALTNSAGEYSFKASSGSYHATFNQTGGSTQPWVVNAMVLKP